MGPDAEDSLNEIERLMADAARARAQAEMLRERQQVLLATFQRIQCELRGTGSEFFCLRYDLGREG